MIFYPKSDYFSLLLFLTIKKNTMHPQCRKIVYYTIHVVKSTCEMSPKPQYVKIPDGLLLPLGFLSTDQIDTFLSHEATVVEEPPK